MHLHPPAGREDHRRNGAPGPAEKRGSRQNRGRRLEAAIQRGGMNNAKREKAPACLHSRYPTRRPKRKSAQTRRPAPTAGGTRRKHGPGPGQSGPLAWRPARTASSGWCSAGNVRQWVRRVPLATRRERSTAPEMCLLPPEQPHEGQLRKGGYSWRNGSCARSRERLTGRPMASQESRPCMSDSRSAPDRGAWAYSKGKCLRLKMMEQPMERRR